MLRKIEMIKVIAKAVFPENYIMDYEEEKWFVKEHMKQSRLSIEGAYETAKIVLESRKILKKRANENKRGK